MKITTKENTNMKKIISLITVISLFFCTAVAGYSDVASSEGWTPVFTSNGPNGSRVDVSPVHKGWASPEATYTDHINVVIYITGVEKSNFHLYKKGKCYKAYESKSKTYSQALNQKCYSNDKDAIIELLESKGIYSMSDTMLSSIEPYLGAAVATVVVGFIIKAIIAFVTANPFILLIPA